LALREGIPRFKPKNNLKQPLARMPSKNFYCFVLSEE
jgi:hypothetical protein